MGTDNVDVFKNIIFHIPELRKILLLLSSLGLVYSTSMFLSFSFLSSQEINLLIIPFLAVLIYIIPAVASGEVLHWLLPNYPRRWGYFLAMVNQVILFVFGMALTLADSMVMTWNIVWLALISVYLSNFFVLLLSVGYENLRKISMGSAVQPLFVLLFFHLFFGRYVQIPISLYLLNLGILLLMGVLLAISFLIFDYLFGSNVSNLSVTQLASGLLQKRQEALDLGYPAEPDVQTFYIENAETDLTVSIPWLHPGPLEGFGGGKITTHVIDAINDEGEGFFFHVPSTHQSDPADPRDTGKLVEAMEKPETVSKASKLYRRDYDNATFYGRAFGNQKIVFMEVEDFDDYEMAVFKEIIDLDNTTIVDMHNHDPHSGERPLMYYSTSIAEKTRERMKDFVEELEELDQSEYKAGFRVERNDPNLMGLVEEVDGQRTLLFGVEGNGSSKNLRELREEYKDRFEEVMLFSTDTHSSIHEMATEKQVDKPDMRKVVSMAQERVSEASIGLSHGKSERMKLLRQDYASLIFSINILVRLIPLTLALFYIVLVVWIL